MLNALRSVRAQPFPALFSTPTTFPGRDASGVRFLQQVVPGPNNQPEKTNKSMEQKQPQNPTSKIADTMSSFGEGYATRSDEEGFGGIYGGNQYLNKTDEEKICDGGTTPNDAAQQGSEVKEKETARNQKTVA